MDFKDFIDDAKSKILGEKAKGENAREGFVDGVSSILGKGQEMASDVAIALVNDFNEMLPVLSLAGYNLRQLEVELGVPPKIISHFVFDGEKTVEPHIALERLTDNRMGYNLMKALMYAEKNKSTFSFTGMEFDHIEIEMGVIPSVRLCYSPESRCGRLTEPSRE
tara:strand:+ start:704 stop:1198 length:495 start_codon:yes stop_codon:yes gene_type:complete